MIEQLQQAPNADKQNPLLLLRGASCHHLCALRDQCIHAYELHLAALRELQQTEQALENKQSELSILAGLSSARSQLERARPLVKECAAAQGKLSRVFAF